LRTFSPGIALTIARKETPARSRSNVTASAQYDANDWPAVVTTSTVPAQAQASLAPGDPSSRYKLIVDIQQQLKRLGCYYGRIDGSWGVGSKDAMKFFMDRVNAALPLEQPDYVLLTLLQAQSGRTCDECPAGQIPAAGGRCVPQAIYAQTRNDAPQAAAAAKETLPWKAVGAAQPATRPLFTPVPTSVVSSEPLPGRMAIGGPKALPPVDSLDAQPMDAGVASVSPGTATAALVQPGVAIAPVAAPAKPPKSRPSRSSLHYDGPGTPRYNLMLSLGGVY
jgi:peptidoglycan hydrolase-like protein with peptidoglycan-binding domain